MDLSTPICWNTGAASAQGLAATTPSGNDSPTVLLTPCTLLDAIQEDSEEESEDKDKDNDGDEAVVAG